MSYAGRVPNRVHLGIAASQATWTQYVNEIGTVYARRFFYSTWAITKLRAKADAIRADGQQPWLSIKVPGNDWQGVVDGDYDDDLDTILDQAAGADDVIYLAVHHEPQNDGDLSVWAAMQAKLSNHFAGEPKLVLYATGNGFWFKPGEMTDAEIAAGPFPPSLLATLAANGDVPGADFYDTQQAGRKTSDGIARAAAWCDRVGVTDFVVPEWGCLTAAEITACWEVLRDRSDLFGAAMYFNSAANSRADWLLKSSNGKLQAFQAALVESVEDDPPPPPPPTPPNDAFASAIALSGATGSTAGNNTGATTELNEPEGERTVWWAWTAPTSESYTVSVAASFPALLEVYEGDDVEEVELLGGVEDPDTAVSFDAVNGTVYGWRVASWDLGDVGQINLSWSPTSTPPPPEPPEPDQDDDGTIVEDDVWVDLEDGTDVPPDTVVDDPAMTP